MGDVSKLERLLHGLGYPHTTSLMIALATRQPAKITNAHRQFHEWHGNHDQIDKMLFDIKKALYTETDFEYETPTTTTSDQLAILTLFMPQPVAKRHAFENMQRDIALGIITNIPPTTFLEVMPDSELDVWKVKIDLKYLKAEDGKIKINQEQPVPIRWLTLHSEGTN